MKRILITGGPVYAHLDSVKIITNRFKGGRIAELAENLFLADDSVRITYLTSKGSVTPAEGTDPFIRVVYHNGFDDYRKKVKKLAPKMDGVILGAAVCNLIPMKPWKDKFPSHNYNVGDRIPIDFTIAPRIIDEVKKVAPRTKLFGFKLLQGVKHKELVRAAYDIVLESGAVAVFANDANDLDVKYAVIKEGGVIEFGKDKYNDFVKFILDAINDKYYSTIQTVTDFDIAYYHDAKRTLRKLSKKYAKRFRGKYGKEAYRFGTIAVRIKNDNAFVTTARGKKDMDELSMVHGVNNKSRSVFATEKATLNAPFLYNIFRRYSQVKAIVHYHASGSVLERLLPYAPSGTFRDSNRKLEWYPEYKKGKAKDHGTTFYIEGHGTFELLTEEELP